MTDIDQMNIDDRFAYVIQNEDDPHKVCGYFKNVFNKADSTPEKRKIISSLIRYALIYIPDIDALNEVFNDIEKIIMGGKIENVINALKICHTDYTNDIGAMIALFKTPKAISEDLTSNSISTFEELLDNTSLDIELIEKIKGVMEHRPEKYNMPVDIAISSLIVRGWRNLSGSEVYDFSRFDVSELKNVETLEIKSDYVVKNNILFSIDENGLKKDGSRLGKANLNSFKELIGFKNTTHNKNTGQLDTMTNKGGCLYTFKESDHGISNTVRKPKTRVSGKSKLVVKPEGEKDHAIDENGWLDNFTLSEESAYRWSQMTDDEKKRQKDSEGKDIDNKKFASEIVKKAREKRGALPPNVFFCENTLDHKKIVKISPISASPQVVFELEDGSVAFIIKPAMKGFRYGTEFNNDVKNRLRLESCEYETVLCDKTPEAKCSEDKKSNKEIIFKDVKCNMVIARGDYRNAFILNSPEFKKSIENEPDKLPECIAVICRIIKYRWIFKIKDYRNGIIINNGRIISFGELYDDGEPGLTKEWLRKGTHTKFLFTSTYAQTVNTIISNFSKDDFHESIDSYVDAEMEEWGEINVDANTVFTRNDYNIRSGEFTAQLRFHEKQSVR